LVGVAVLAPCLGWPAALGAEAPRSMTLAEAVDYALAHNPRVSQAAAVRLVAQGRTDAARAGLLPDVSIVAQLNRGTGNVVPGPLFSLPGIPDVSGQPRGRTFDSGVFGPAVGAGASWDILLLQRQMAAIDAALAEEGRVEAAIAALKLDVAFSAADRFLTTLSRGEIVLKRESRELPSGSHVTVKRSDAGIAK
jgi:outer membrane protein TolC